MSTFEIILIVLVCAVPIIALIFILPKFKKKEKNKEEQPTKTLDELKKEEKKQENSAKTYEIKEDEKDEISSKDIQSYIDYKKKNLTKPKRVEMPNNFKDATMPYMPKRRQTSNKPQNVAEEIRNLSPVLKAMIIAGVLDKKDY